MFHHYDKMLKKHYSPQERPGVISQSSTQGLSVLLFLGCGELGHMVDMVEKTWQDTTPFKGNSQHLLPSTVSHLLTVHPLPMSSNYDSHQR